MTIRVFVADDCLLIRTGVRTILNQDTSIVIVGEAESGIYLQDETLKTKPDVLLLDVGMPGIWNISATVRDLLAEVPDLKILIISSTSHPMLTSELLDVGIEGYIVKDEMCKGDNLLEAVHKVNAGERILSQKVAGSLYRSNPLPTFPPKTDQTLTDRENDVIRLVGKGYTNYQIAVALGISHHTVKDYITKLRNKLGLNGRYEVGLYAVQHGLVEVNLLEGRRRE